MLKTKMILMPKTASWWGSVGCGASAMRGSCSRYWTRPEFLLSWVKRRPSVDDVTSNFADGVGVAVMRIGAPWAYDAMQRNYFPEDEPPAAPEESDDRAVHCPKCHSTEVIFEKLVDEPSGDNSGAKFQWTCDSCGYEWEDDGEVTK